jgi:predicted transcriptional regulator
MVMYRWGMDTDELLEQLINEHRLVTEAEAAYRARVAERTVTMRALADRGVTAYRMANLLGLSYSALGKFVGARAKAKAATQAEG